MSYKLCHKKSAVEVTLVPNNENMPGRIVLKIAKQTGESFDWDNSLFVDLEHDELSQFIQLFRGMKESIGNGDYSGSGVTNKCGVHIRFRHMIDPSPGYRLDCEDIMHKQNASFTFNTNEAVMLMIAIESAIPYVLFGKEINNA